MRNRTVLAALFLGVLAASPVAAASKGSSMLSLGLGQGSAELYAPTNLGIAAGSYLEPGQSPETRAGFEYWYAFSDDYALAFSGAYGLSRMKWESSDSADPEIKASSTSFKLRVGGDRLGQVSDRFLLFMGPGLEFWNGKSKLEVGTSETESESVTRIGVSGRIGGVMMLSQSAGIMGQVGHTFGYASVDDSGAKSTWWPSSFEASWGLLFSFGGQR